MLLLIPASTLAGVLRREFRFDDDWSMLAIPAGMALGLALFVRYWRRTWLRVLAGIMAALVVVAFACLMVPAHIPDSVPEGMNRLPYAIGNAIRVALLVTFAGVAVVSYAIALAVNWCGRIVRRYLPQRRLENALQAFESPTSTSASTILDSKDE